MKKIRIEIFVDVTPSHDEIKIIADSVFEHKVTEHYQIEVNNFGGSLDTNSSRESLITFLDVHVFNFKNRSE